MPLPILPLFNISKPKPALVHEPQADPPELGEVFAHLPDTINQPVVSRPPRRIGADYYFNIPINQNHALSPMIYHGALCRANHLSPLRRTSLGWYNRILVLNRHDIAFWLLLIVVSLFSPPHLAIDHETTSWNLLYLKSVSRGNPSGGGVEFGGI